MTTPIVPQRTCKACNQTFPLTTEYWHRDKHAAYGLGYSCKECAKAKARKWHHGNRERANRRSLDYAASHRDESRGRAQKWHWDNRERALKSHRDYYQANREWVIARNQEWAERNREKSNAIKRAYVKRDPERRKAQARKWHYQYPEKSKALRHRRRKAPGSFTAEDVRQQYRSQNGKCWHCGTLVGSEYHVDHLIPLARGGSNAANNIVISCAHCNLSKGDRLPSEWNGKLF